MMDSIMGRQLPPSLEEPTVTQSSAGFIIPNCGPPLADPRAYPAPPPSPDILLDGAAQPAESDLRSGRRSLQKMLALRDLQIKANSPLATMWLHRAKLRGIHFVTTDYSHPTSLRFHSDESVILVEVALRGGAVHRAGNAAHVIRPGQAFFYAPGVPHRRTTDAGYHSLVIQFQRQALEDRLAHLLQRPIRQPLAFDSSLDIGAGGQSFWRLVKWLYGEITEPKCAPLWPKSIACKAEKILFETLLYAHHSNYSLALSAREPIAIPRHLHSIIGAIRAAPEHDWTLSTMAVQAKVSVRTVCEAFRHFHGCTPMEFLRSVRLARTNEELKQLDPHTSVASVAKRWGFGHAGRFAAAYAKTFGETPSDTLRGSKRLEEESVIGESLIEETLIQESAPAAPPGIDRPLAVIHGP
jgi:AraC-like DNA-binding protein